MKKPPIGLLMGFARRSCRNTPAFVTSIEACFWKCALLFVIVATAGCGPTLRSATRPSIGGAEPDSVTAVVVVVQPTWRTPAVNFLDSRGVLLGQINNRSQTVLRVPPGPIKLYALIGNDPDSGDRIGGDLLAGRKYYATIIDTASRSMNLSGVNRSSLHGKRRREISNIGATA